MFALGREVNWAATPLGAPEGWSPALRTAVGVVLHAKLPMVVRWGPELVQIYNDAYVSHLGPARHPTANADAGDDHDSDASEPEPAATLTDAEVHETNS